MYFCMYKLYIHTYIHTLYLNSFYFTCHNCWFYWSGIHFRSVILSKCYRCFFYLDDNETSIHVLLLSICIYTYIHVCIRIFFNSYMPNLFVSHDIHCFQTCHVMLYYIIIQYRVYIFVCISYTCIYYAFFVVFQSSSPLPPLPSLSLHQFYSSYKVATSTHAF